MNKTFQLFLEVQVAQSMLAIEVTNARSRAQLGLSVELIRVQTAKTNYLQLCRALTARQAFIADPCKSTAFRMVFFVDGRWVDFSALEHQALELAIPTEDCIPHQLIIQEQVGRIVSAFQLDQVEADALGLLLGASPHAWCCAGLLVQSQLNTIDRRAKLGPMPRKTRAAMFALAANLDTRASTVPPA